MLNSTLDTGLPPLPAYSLTPREPLLPPIPDYIIVLILPILAYWIVSMVFHWIDVNDYFSQYRLHTPEELLQRNHVSRWEVVRDVVIQQIIQTVFGLLMAYVEETEYVGKEDYDIAVWARRIRIAQRVIPRLLLLLGIDATGLAGKLSSYPALAVAITGGQHSTLTQEVVLDTGSIVITPAFAKWELLAASAVYWYLIPAVQFLFAIFFVDTWQYFLHRAMHMNRWLYTTFHSRHHRLYVPYAFGALYNHPVEGFLLDTAGTGIAFLLSRMTARQAMWFFTCSTIKTIDDHCGYAFPFDPLQHITSNNAAYHDIHHQSWGIKTNFSQPFFTFWDRLLDTKWSGGDVTLRYERARLQASRAMKDHDQSPKAGKVDQPARSLLTKSVSKTATPFSPQTEPLKNTSHRLNGSILHK
ncbi:Sphingolipid C4-hydroxylase sur2 [Ophidiomyces ophidiicola]|nr:Sphingolipid C4-hydroxylase sur2 [Ophidiomyces ophidiicola]KAI1956366.1 Sphingolipid C4-hydroxylase sur2 [Ophidiomyces ophidiicola]